ncbi:hypothetical protein SO802_021922 [Lithocarpus litseifolius]|uniref:Myb/SANT-like domain-containing protein n=1 Tax=Lithocarpus litseifolius TaxID=425828 RepID=A0AAW2CGG5_9ROSI
MYHFTTTCLMADPSDAEDMRLWPAPIEKQFIDILLEEEAKGNIPNGQFKKNIWPFVTDEFNRRTGKRYSHTFAQLIGRTGMGWDPVTNTVTGSDAVWAHTASLNSRCKEFRNKGLEHHELLGQLFHTGTATGFLQISSAQPAPNSDEEQELDVAVLAQGLHVSVEPDSADDVGKLPPLDMGQCSNPKGKQLAHSDTSTGKKGKVRSLDRATYAIMEFMEMSRKRRSDKKSKSQKTVESTSMHDPFSMAKAVDIVNSIPDVDDYTLFKVLEKFHEPESGVAFITLNPERRWGWMEQVTSASSAEHKKYLSSYKSFCFCDVEHEIMTIYVAIVADYIQTHYKMTPMCTRALFGKSYVQETLDEHPQTCYNTFRMAKPVFLHLCNELKRLHLLE